MRKKKEKIVFQTKHHIFPKSHGGTNKKDNIIFVTNTKHQAYHTIFQDATPLEVIKILIEEWGFENYIKIKV